MRLALLATAATLLALPAFANCDSSVGSDWRDISSAPHDGTVIEFAETYGVAPWYGIAHWSNKMTAIDQSGKPVQFTSDHYEWVEEDKPGSSVNEDDCLKWRPYEGQTTGYVDPTGGMTPEYWQLRTGVQVR